MSIYFESYSEFEEWCVENNFDADTQIDRTEESHKRDTLVCFYMKHKEMDIYRDVSFTASYDWGWSNVDVGEVDLTRKVTQVMTEKVEYV